MPILKALEMENFQCFGDPVRIEFSPITLLYGPNSAGKSCVYDALELIHRIWDPTVYDEPMVRDLIFRWMRRVDGTRKPMRLAIEFECSNKEADSDAIWNDATNWPQRRPRISDSGPITGFRIEDFDEPAWKEGEPYALNIRLDLQITIYDSAPQVGQEHRTGPELSKPWVSAIKASINDRTVFSFGDLAEDPYGLSDVIFDGYRNTRTAMIDPIHMSTEAGMAHLAAQKPTSVDTSLLTLDLTQFSSPTDHSSIEHKALHTLFALNISDLCFQIGTLVGKMFRNTPPTVCADRTAPTTDTNLSVVRTDDVMYWDRSDPHAPDNPTRELERRIQGDDPYIGLLAKSAHSALLMQTSEQYELEDVEWEGLVEKIREDAAIVDRINQHLESHLFREKLYRVECASVLMSPIDPQTDSDQWGRLSFMQPAVVRLHVRDSQGRKHGLQDIGSGIPFVLPVLYAATAGSLCRVQQPELHLHPRLQSELGDVFVQERKRSAQSLFIIETHSEHLLLRLLRRIRDTDKGAPSSQDLPLHPQDIAIYYFDPQIDDDRTLVLKQPVTPTGDFYYDWPRGFFAEREQDLFE